MEFADPGRILRIDLVSGAQTVLFDAVANGIGLALSADGNTAWVTEQPSDADTRLVRVDLATRNKSVVLPGLTAAFFLRWVDASRSALYLVERDPANAVRSVDVTTGAISSRVVASGLPSRPSSVYPIPGPRLLVCSDTELSSVELAAGAFSAAGTYLLGIGHVPATEISADGYATTDASYFFHVVDCPFGGTLPVMINHERAFGEGNRYYQVYLKGVKQTAAFTDYLWSTALNRFVAVTVAPDDSGYWPVRAPSQLWYNHWLGGLVNTGALPAALKHNPAAG